MQTWLRNILKAIIFYKARKSESAEVRKQGSGEARKRITSSLTNFRACDGIAKYVIRLSLYAARSFIHD